MSGGEGGIEDETHCSLFVFERGNIRFVVV